MKQVKIRNRRNGSESMMSVEQWEKIKNSPQWQGVFVLVNIPEPKEVTELKEAKAAKKDKTEEAN